ncbi:hypothetical protein D3C81_1597890 [compost metagenome]
MRQPAHHRYHRPHRHRAGHVLGAPLRQAHFLIQRQQPARLRQQFAAVRVQHGHPAAAVEQFTAQFLFERTHLQADRRLRQRHPAGSGGKRALLGHGDEGAEKSDGTHAGPTTRFSC